MGNDAGSAPAEARVIARLECRGYPTVLRPIRNDRLYVADDGPGGKGIELCVWDWRNNRVLNRIVMAGCKCARGIVFRQESRLLGIGKARAYLYDLETRAEVHQFTKHYHEINDLIMLPGERRFITVSDDCMCAVWDVDAQDEMSDLLASFEGHGDLAFDGRGLPVYSVDVSRDGRRAVSGDSEGHVMVWNVEDGELLRHLRAPVRKTGGAGSDRPRTPTYSVHRPFLRQGDPPEPYTDMSPEEFSMRCVEKVAFCGDGGHVAVGTMGAVSVIDIESGRVLFTHWDGISDLAVSADGRHLALNVGQQPILVLDAMSGRLVCTVRGHKDADSGFEVGNVFNLYFTPSGHLVTEGTDNSVQVWELGR